MGGGFNASEFDLKPIMSRKRQKRASHERNKGACCVYFIDCEGSDLVKVGRSSGVSVRIRGVGESLGAPVGQKRIWGMIKCEKSESARLEKAVHNALAEWRAEGEWFSVRRADIKQIVHGVAAEILGGRAEITGLGRDDPQGRSDHAPVENGHISRNNSRGMLPRIYMKC
jgi:hypothetical protein